MLSSFVEVVFLVAGGALVQLLRWRANVSLFLYSFAALALRYSAVVDVDLPGIK